jgi:5-methylcytosine-specific restriction endonuclease McrA
METILVLNSDYTPLNITTFKRAIVLVVKGKAEIVKDDVGVVRTENITYTKPLIIRLFKYITHKMKKIRVNRQRLYKRDNNECAYCGSKKELTIDHILPKSRGGKNSWSNLITCCLSCNLKKGDKTPEEAKMPLLFTPKIPSFLSNDSSIKKIWEDFKSSFVY